MVLWIVGLPAERVAIAWTKPPAQTVPLDQRPDLPLVVSSGLIYYEMNHYAPPQLAARTWYLSDQQAALRITGTNVFEGFPAMDRMFPFRAKLGSYHSFVKTNRHFLVYGYAVYENDWLVSKLMEDGARLTFLGRRDEEFGRAVLYEVQMPELQVSSAR
jgi:hypothetical protein